MRGKKEAVSSRDPSLDIIRCFAFSMVVTVHFLLRSGIYEVPVTSFTTYLVCVIRTIGVVCVPLFILLTGYLQRNKKPEASYFVRIIPVLTVYFLCAAANIIFDNAYGIRHDSAFQCVLRMLNFKGARYAWYIEMYIGLFLFSPYLNLIWKGLENKHQRRVLIGIMAFVSLGPALFNIWRFSPPGWWLVPSSNTNYHKIYPDWWKNLYPITYYFIGCYLAEYRVRMKRGRTLAAVLVLTLLGGAFNFWRSTPEPFVAGAWNNYASPLTAVISVLIFIFFLSGDYSGLSDRRRKFWASWSALTLGAYLLSNITDTVIYDRLAMMVEDPARRMVWILVTVPLSAAGACAMAWVVNLAAGPVSDKLMALALGKAGKKKNGKPDLRGK